MTIFFTTQRGQFLTPLGGQFSTPIDNVEYEVVLIDATETPIERPKKDKRTSTPAKRRGTL